MNHLTKACISCGMTMTKPEEFGGQKVGNDSCVYCSHEDGNLKERNVVREQMVRFWMSREEIDRTVAEEKTDEYMAKMPAWK
ncbi:MAG: zinc ribbon domain-containing protein [Candidatus Thorarchaeota archaeon]